MFARHHQLGNRGKDRMSRLIALIVFLVLAGGPAQAQSGAVISWRVENPFRLFTDPGMTEVHRQVFEGLTDAERIEPVLSAERRLMELYPEGWAKSMYEATCWRPDGNRYGPCAADDDYINPESHEVVATLAGLASPVGTCTWQVRPFGSDRSKARVVSAPCAGTVSLDIPYPGGARVTALVNGNPMATTDMVVRDIFVAGIGDSFASGEGNPDRPAEFSSERTISYGAAPDGTPLDGYPARVGDWQDVGDSVFLENGTRWLSQACHRSLYSYQTRVALQLAIEDPHRAVTYVTFACAGAEVTFGLMVRYKGTEWAPDQPDKPQVSAAARAQCGDAAVVGPVEELAALVGAHAGEKIPLVIAVEVNREGFARGVVTLQELVFDIRLTGRGNQRGHPVLRREDVVDLRARRHEARPAHKRRDTVAAFPVGVLFPAERRKAAVRPGKCLSAIVGRVDDDRIVGDTEVVERLQELPDLAIVLHHAVGIDAEAGLAL